MEKELKKLDRKTRVTGGSVVSTIPKEVVTALNVNAGDEIRFIITTDGKVELEKVDNPAEKLGVSNDFLKILNKGMEKYDGALRQLVER